MKNNINITVIDSCMGSGKTTYFEKFMNENNSKRYLYITPFLEEISRVRKSVKKLREPNVYNNSKFKHFKQLIKEGRHIATTHAMLSKFDLEIQEFLSINNYTLILDEVADVVSPYRFPSKSDEKAFYEYFGGVDEEGYLYWDVEKNPPDQYDGRFKEEMTLCLNKNLIKLNGEIYLWELPVEIFSVFKEVYILTYMFNGSLQKSYFDLFGVKYQYKSVKDGELIEYTPTTQEEKEVWKNRIQVIDDAKLNNIGKLPYSLSSTWYKDYVKKSGKETTHQKRLRKNLYTFFMYRAKAKSKDSLWSVFSPYVNRLKGLGYSKGHLSFNARATNDYQHKTALAYLVNIYPHVNVLMYFRKKGIKVNQEEYALSILIQWIWRSKIRDTNSDEKIVLYLPSERMRNLFLEWLN